MKKLGMAIGIFLLLVLAVAVVVPMVVDVDKYRPTIVDMANRKIHGQLELGKLRLSLWGQIRIEVAGLKLRDSGGHEVLSVQNAYFHLPFLPLFSGAPILTLSLNQPEIRLIKDRTGKLNVMSLVQEVPSPSVSPGSPPSISPPPVGSLGNSTDGKVTAVPAIVTRARLGIELNHAQVSYMDQLTGLSSQVKDLNFVMRNISLSHPTDFELWADLDTEMGASFRLHGPARWEGRAQPELKGGQLSQVSITSRLDLDQLEMSVPGIFEKKAGIPTHIELAMTASESEAKIEKFVARFFNAEVNARGTVTHLSSSRDAKAASPVVSMFMNSNAIELGPWVNLVPLLKGYDLGGTAKFDAEVSGPSEKLGYRADISVNGLTAKAPKLKVQPKIDGTMHVVTDRIESILVNLTAPGNELKIQGKLISFSKPKLDLIVTSSGMDLDQLVDFPPPSSASSGAQTVASGSVAPKSGSGSSAPASGPASESSENPKVNKPLSDYDALLAPLRENKMAQNFSANISLDMKLLKAYGVSMSDIGCRLTFKDLAAGLDACGLKIFAGIVKSDFHIQMKPSKPTYQFNAHVNGLDINQAVASQMALFKNTVLGKATFSMSGQGASLNPDPAISNLKARGNMKVDQATFTTIDVMKMVSEALNKALNQIGNQVPAVRGRTIGPLPTHGSRYEFIASDYVIENGKFSAPNFYAKAAVGEGIDIKGMTTVGMKDYSLDTSWDLIDTYNLTRLRDISVDQNGIHVDHLFAEGNAPVHFPVHAGCTIKAPCYSSTDVAVALGRVALGNLGHALSSKAKDEIKKQAEVLLKQVDPALQEKVKDQLKDKLKGLFE